MYNLPLWAHPQIRSCFQLYAGCAPLAPPLEEDFVPYNCFSLDVPPEPRSGLPPRPFRAVVFRSTERSFRIIPFARTTTRQNHAFPVVGPLLWNWLSLQLRLFPTGLSLALSFLMFPDYYAHLKTFLFSRTGIGSATE